MDQIHDGKVELSAAVLEKLLADHSKTLEPIARMLGSYYKTLILNGSAADIAGVLVRDMQLHIIQSTLAQQELNDKLKLITDATAELNKAVDRYKDMMEGYSDVE